MTDRVPVLVAASGAAWETTALDVVVRSPALVLHKRCVDLADLLATSATGLAGVAVVSASLPGLDADSVASLQRAGSGIVVVTDVADGRADPDRLRRLGAGHVLAAADIGDLAAHISGASAATAPQRAGSRSSSPDPRPGQDPGAGRVTAVWGPAGAPGRTTVAVGLAAELAARGRATLLVDADPYAGSVAQHLGVLDQASGLLAAARLANTGRLDVGRLAALAREVDGLRVLSGLPRAERWVEVREAAFQEILDVAAAVVDHVLLDVGFSLEGGPGDPFGGPGPARNQMTLAALERADEVLVVGAADPVGLARLARGLVELRDLAPGTALRVVVNRCRPTLGWDATEVRGMVEGFVTPVGVHFLPDDRKAVDRALMAGTSLRHSGDSELRAALAALADELLGAGSVQRRGGRFLGRAGVRRRRAGTAR